MTGGARGDAQGDKPIRNRTTRIQEDGARLVEHGYGRVVSVSNRGGAPNGSDPLGWAALLRAAADETERLEREELVRFTGMQAESSGREKTVSLYFYDLREHGPGPEMDDDLRAHLSLPPEERRRREDAALAEPPPRGS